MFNNIRCEYPLPMPDDLMELANIKFNETIYQTKDLECLLDDYTIRKDGTLWITRCEYEHTPGNPEAKSFMDRFGNSKLIKQWEEQVIYTGEISFYDNFQDSGELDGGVWKNDYWVEYTALFINGVISNIRLTKFEAIDNTERKANALEFLENMKTREELWNRWYIKYIYTYYDKLLSFIFKLYRKLSQKLPPSYKVESFFRWL